MSLMASKKLADIEYHGQYGFSESCLHAIVRLIQCGELIVKASLLTWNGKHCFLLHYYKQGLIAISPGFTSGYSGEGPAKLAETLLILKRHGIETEEYEVSQSFMERVRDCCLTDADIDSIEQAKPIRPLRLHDYIYEVRKNRTIKEDGLTRKFPAVIPFRIIDRRIFDLALKLENDADSALMTAYRRLEQIILERCELNGSFGSKLLEKAFEGSNSRLYWHGLDGTEGLGRAFMFKAAFMAFRNRRAHKELEYDSEESLREFLIVNELYLLEAEAIERPITE